jgi:hypothetical protein
MFPSQPASWLSAHRPGVEPTPRRVYPVAHSRSFLMPQCLPYPVAASGVIGAGNLSNQQIRDLRLFVLVALAYAVALSHAAQHRHAPSA